MWRLSERNHVNETMIRTVHDNTCTVLYLVLCNIVSALCAMLFAYPVLPGLIQNSCKGHSLSTRCIYMGLLGSIQSVHMASVAAVAAVAHRHDVGPDLSVYVLTVVSVSLRRDILSCTTSLILLLWRSFFLSSKLWFKR